MEADTSNGKESKGLQGSLLSSVLLPILPIPSIDVCVLDFAVMLAEYLAQGTNPFLANYLACVRLLGGRGWYGGLPRHLKLALRYYGAEFSIA
jgi:hypothetical protein